MRKNILKLFLISALSLSLIACGNDKKEEVNKGADKVVEEFKPEETKYPLTMTDSYDREVTLEAEPGRIVSLSPSITETIYEMNRGAKVVARTDEDAYPDAVALLDSVGSVDKLDIEKIKSLNPNLVLGSKNLKKEVVKELEEAGLNVIVLFEEEGFAGIYKLIQNLGVAINSQEQAHEVMEEMKSEVDEVSEKVKGQKKKTTYYVSTFGQGKDTTVSKDSIIDNIIETAGGDNITSNSKDGKYSIDELKKKDPEILLVSGDEATKEELMNTEGYKDLTAVKESRVYAIDENSINRQGPRLSKGLLELARIIQPDAFK